MRYVFAFALLAACSSSSSEEPAAPPCTEPANEQLGACFTPYEGHIVTADASAIQTWVLAGFEATSSFPTANGSIDFDIDLQSYTWVFTDGAFVDLKVAKESRFGWSETTPGASPPTFYDDARTGSIHCEHTTTVVVCRVTNVQVPSLPGTINGWIHAPLPERPVANVDVGTKP